MVPPDEDDEDDEDDEPGLEGAVPAEPPPPPPPLLLVEDGAEVTGAGVDAFVVVLISGTCFGKTWAMMLTELLTAWVTGLFSGTAAVGSTTV